MKDALIIFQKNPQPGKVKTRLAATIGDDKALKIYEVLVNHTHDLVKQLDVKRYLFFAMHLDSDEQWNHCDGRVQKGDDLGAKMFHAINEVRAEGAERVVVIGTDCYELNVDILKQSFEDLKSHDYCIGPAEDGGYYLIGTTAPDKEVFLNKEWSTETVFEEAKSNISNIGKSLAVLPVLSDVDYEEDLKELKEYL